MTASRQSNHYWLVIEISSSCSAGYSNTRDMFFQNSFAATTAGDEFSHRSKE